MKNDTWKYLVVPVLNRKSIEKNNSVCTIPLYCYRNANAYSNFTKYKFWGEKWFQMLTCDTIQYNISNCVPKYFILFLLGIKLH